MTKRPISKRAEELIICEWPAGVRCTRQRWLKVLAARKRLGRILSERDVLRELDLLPVSAGAREAEVLRRLAQAGREIADSAYGRAGAKGRGAKARRQTRYQRISSKQPASGAQRKAQKPQPLKRKG